MKRRSLKLRSLYIEITNKCNFSCVSCYNDSSSRNDVFLDFTTVERLISECKSLEGEIIYFSGGEPLLHSRIWDMVDCCINKGIEPLIVTNGSLLDESNIKKLIETGTSLQISLDGYDAYTNDMIRGSGSFVKVTRALEVLNAHNYTSKVRVRCTLNKLNCDNLAAYVELAKKYNVRELSFGWMAPLGRGSNCFEHIGIGEGDYFELYKNVNSLKEQYESDVLSIGQMELINCCPMLSEGDFPIELNMRITPQGDVCLCQRMSVKSEVLGNIHRESINEILISAKIENLLNRLFERKKMMAESCKKCFISCVCKRGCPGLAVQRGSEHAMDDFCLPRKQLYYQILQNNK